MKKNVAWNHHLWALSLTIKIENDWRNLIILCIMTNNYTIVKNELSSHTLNEQSNIEFRWANHPKDCNTIGSKLSTLQTSASDTVATRCPGQTFQRWKNLPSNLGGMKLADVLWKCWAILSQKKVEKTLRDFETLSPSHQKTPHQIRIS